MSRALSNPLWWLVRICRDGTELPVIASGALGKKREFSLPPLPAGEGHGSRRDQPDHESHPPGDKTSRPRQRVALDDSYNEVRRDEARKDERHLPPLHHGNLLPKKACSGTYRLSAHHAARAAMTRAQPAVGS